MQSLIQQLAEWLGIAPSTVIGILWTIAVVFSLSLARVFLHHIVRKRVTDEKAAFHWRRLITYLLTAVGAILLIRVWVTKFGNIGTFLGLLTAGLAVALGDLLKDLAGWAFILARRPYQIGDRIEMGGHMGDVIDIRLFLTYILECGEWVDADQSTGRIVMLPNGMVFQTPVANFTRGFDHIWDEIPVLVTFESDWRLAKTLLNEIGREHAAPLARDAQQQLQETARDHALFFRNLTPIVYTSVHDCGVMLTLRYLTPARQRRSSQERIWEAILDAFAAQDGIDFAYPTRRTFINYIEGKPGARAEGPDSSANPRTHARKQE